MASSQTTIVATATAAAVATGLLAYAVYFDHARRSKPEFRRQLRRNERKQARQAKVEAEVETLHQRVAIKESVDEAKEEGFPTSVEEKEAYFLDQVTMGEQLGADPSRSLEAALAFYKGLKVYPQPQDLIGIYDKTVPKPILDLLAEMIAYDEDLRIPMQMPGVANLGNLGDMPTVGLD
ncbi:mitochondrial import receptor subunit tom20 [Gnomoniopsis sp. IMI 355080]|uniref:Mitochondrial import receptor subunit TOM20 n=1 Tax=Gnomoniopsis smithogilvyi TaxID=1191159 RepID=A0A9W8YR27_9PEZI|nr:mitochondrial import receptor subunit tom20 [Gnomoniopsis smithogilvyi]KAJ4423059.1 mitochondrial import receptor subunit tom20 [Gnomoniopsis sp. IMI 355080]